MFAWDPIGGTGVAGPDAAFCRMHDYFSWPDPGERYAVAGGWIGRVWNQEAQVWTVLVTVYESRDGLFGSEHWWALRRDLVFGDCSRVTYDEAVKAKGGEIGEAAVSATSHPAVSPRG